MKATSAFIFLVLSGCIPAAISDAGVAEVDFGMVVDVIDAGAALDSGIMDAGVIDAGGPFDAGVPDAGLSCLALDAVDLNEADAGRVFLFEGEVGGDFVPRLAWDNLWRVWGTPQPTDVPAAMNARYGFTPALTANNNLPMGFRQVGAQVRANCLLCHAGTVAGETVIGAANNQVDLELLVDDLNALAALFGMPRNPLLLRTGAKGVSDIVGMTIQLGLRGMPAPPVPVNTEIGFQDAPAWWNLSTKTRLYADGSADSRSHRTFMATQMAFGSTQAQLEMLEAQYIQLRQYLLSLAAPTWPFAPPEISAVERGRALYRTRCTTCHRDDRCERSVSVEVPFASVGTDSERSIKYGTNEITMMNLSWFTLGSPLRNTMGYVAPSLKGVWASAPYFHNGSVPNLETVLDSSKRPTYFRILGTALNQYDPQKVGFKFEVLTAAPLNPPRATRSWVYDTTKIGLRNTGHLYGDSLSATERADVIEFLKTQ